MAKKNSKKSISLTLRNYFITGVVVLIPIGFTLYLTKILSDKGISLSRLARGIPIGSDLGYIDSATLVRAMEGRTSV